MLYSTLVPEILPEVIGCPDTTIERAVRDAAIEFCDTALVYTVDQDPVAVTKGLTEVDLDIPTGARLVQVLRVMLGSYELTRMSREDLFSSGRAWQTDTGRPQAVTFATEASIRLVPIADQSLTEKLYIRFAVTPTRAATSVPDSIAERYYLEIVFGAKATLLLIPGQTWSNPQLAMAHRSAFERGMREARLTSSQDGVANNRRFRIPRAV